MAADHTTDITVFLTNIGCGEYASVFVKERVDMDALPLLSEDDLKGLGIPLGPRKKILNEVHNIKKADEQPKHLGLLAGGKNLGSGIIDGVTGVFTEPMKGAKEEGAIGLVKGMGKGLVGLVTKPVGGAVKAVESTVQGVKNTPSAVQGATGGEAKKE